MQRAAAAASPTTTTTVSTAALGNAPPSKRQKITPPSELDAIRAALDAEEAKRSEARDRQAAAIGGAGETKWVLSLVDRGGEGGVGESGLRVLSTGHSEIDDGDGYIRERWLPSSGLGRRSFGRFNRELEVRSPTQSLVRRFRISLRNYLQMHLDAPKCSKQPFIFPR